MSASRTRQGTAQPVLGRQLREEIERGSTTLLTDVDQGVGAMTEVKVSDRPMTMQGAPGRLPDLMSAVALIEPCVW